MQYFEWYYPADGTLWKKLTHEAEALSCSGITAVWVPPACKGEQGAESRGYDIYDFYDLGEFNQKGTVRTKYGTKEEYVRMVETLHQHNIQLYADVVFNHLAGADETEKVWVRKMNPESNTEFISEPNKKRSEYFLKKLTHQTEFIFSSPSQHHYKPINNLAVVIKIFTALLFKKFTCKWKTRQFFCFYFAYKPCEETKQ